MVTWPWDHDHGRGLVWIRTVNLVDLYRYSHVDTQCDEAPLLSSPLLIVVVALSTVGCFEDPGYSGGDSGDDGSDETGTDPKHFGPCWCATIEGARVKQNGWHPINDLPYAGPTDCIGADSETHAALEAYVQPIDPADTDLVAFREAVFAAAEARCDELADAFAGNPNSVNECYEILDASSPIWTKGESEVCPVAEGFNAPPPDHWSSYYRLAAMIGQNSVGTYEIDQAFYEDVLANPWWLAQDSMYIALDANSDFAFFNVDSSDLVYALGIRSGDVPLTVNGHDVSSMAGALAAYAALWSESDFELVLARPTGPVTLHYTLVP